ncbi:hypothetical protein C8A05DRAFT_19750 [Staphylotrichum tortipilum]|uniref:F-box domain-containing protein n=1 Tax=Staphylotrichum tortipilum TaxID=2831512 RepID=A0AAN6MBU4_9PEZI|nr:hypothetical protein C8A05DRAFT_19750 [Staphylotrichum longicolle]
MATPSGDKLGRLSSSSRDGRLPLIHGLAAEVVAQILACLDSSSLSSALLAHPLFRVTFQVYQQRILKESLLNLIPPKLLALAFATHDAATIDYSDWNMIKRLLEQLTEVQGGSNPRPLSWPLTRRTVAAIERVHLMVQYFTSDFVQQAIPRLNRIFETTRPETYISQYEELRILRAFYRFQLYCNIFGRKTVDAAKQAPPTIRGWPRQPWPGKSPEDVQCELELFFWPWPPWANEQLACVFEYLETNISVYFNDVASHDIEWGRRQVDWVEPTVAIPHRQFLVSWFMCPEFSCTTLSPSSGKC